MTVILPGTGTKQHKGQAKKPNQKSKLKVHVDREGDTVIAEQSDMYNFDDYF